MRAIQYLLQAANTERVEAGLSIVRKLLTENTSGLTTRELYNLALQETYTKPFHPFVRPSPTPAGPKALQKELPPLPPHPEHPIQSMSFLKQHVLPVLEQKGEFRKSRITRTVEQQQPVASQLIGKGSKKKNSPAPATATEGGVVRTSEVYAWVWRPFEGPRRVPENALQWPKSKSVGEPVGMGEDWSHLNTRRQKARTRKVARAYDNMRTNEVKRLSYTRGQQVEN